MLFFLSFICFVALLCSLFFDGQVFIALEPYYSISCSYAHAVAMLSLALLGTTVLVKGVKKVVLGPLGLYAGYKKRRQEQAGLKALQGYMLYLGGQTAGIEQFKRYSGVLSNNPFYAVAGFMSGEPETVKTSCDALEQYENGSFFETYNRVNYFLQEEQYENALILLEHAPNFTHSMKWLWIAMFECYKNLGKFDKAAATIKPLRGLGVRVAPYELSLARAQAAAGADPLQNLEVCYHMDVTDTEVVLEYAQALSENNQQDKAAKVIKTAWKTSPSVEAGLLYEKMVHSLVPVERFSVISELAELNPTHYASKYMLAKSALDAGLFLIARDTLMQLAKTHPSLAFPLLAKLEKVEKHDLEESNRWLEQALALE